VLGFRPESLVVAADGEDGFEVTVHAVEVSAPTPRPRHLRRREQVVDRPDVIARVDPAAVPTRGAASSSASSRTRFTLRPVTGNRTARSVGGDRRRRGPSLGEAGSPFRGGSSNGGHRELRRAGDQGVGVAHAGGRAAGLGRPGDRRARRPRLARLDAPQLLRPRRRARARRRQELRRAALRLRGRRAGPDRMGRRPAP
jgi:hypothetical protein